MNYFLKKDLQLFYLHLIFQFDPKCVNVEYVPFTSELKSFIITSHNKLRNKVASGTFEQFPSAARMLVMVRHIFPFKLINFSPPNNIVTFMLRK